MWTKLFIYLLSSLAVILLASLLIDLISLPLSFITKVVDDKTKGFIKGTIWGLISSFLVGILFILFKFQTDSLIFFIIAIEVVAIEFFIIAQQKITITISQLSYRYNYLLGSLFGLVVGYSIL